VFFLLLRLMQLGIIILDFSSIFYI